jgi:hypothetical protein
MEDSRRCGTHVPRYALMITDNATDALLLSQLTYWLTDNRGHPPRREKGIPCRWAAQTSTELGRQLCRTVDEIDKSLTRLKRKGFIQWKKKMFNGKLHRHIWLIWDQIAQSYEEVKENYNDMLLG